MSQGTSGDQQWMDYGTPQSKIDIDAYAKAVAGVALDAYNNITYHENVPLAMAETTLSLGRRIPDNDRLAWARPIVAAMGDGVPKSQVDVYAREAVLLHENPVRELKLQAIRIGGLGIAAIPDEVYAITGLKIKGRSPLETTFTIELANGSEGYIPPPEQHALGGYTTWPARTAGLEVQAEPKIVETVLGLLENVAGTERRDWRSRPGRTPERSSRRSRWRTGGWARSTARRPPTRPETSTRPRSSRASRSISMARRRWDSPTRARPTGRLTSRGVGSRRGSTGWVRRTRSNSGSGTACRTTPGP